MNRHKYNKTYEQKTEYKSLLNRKKIAQFFLFGCVYLFWDKSFSTRFVANALKRLFPMCEYASTVKNNGWLFLAPPKWYFMWRGKWKQLKFMHVKIFWRFKLSHTCTTTSCYIYFQTETMPMDCLFILLLLLINFWNCLNGSAFVGVPHELFYRKFVKELQIE